MSSYCFQLPDGINAYMPAFYLDNGSFCLAAGIIYKLDDTINPLYRLLSFSRQGV